MTHSTRPGLTVALDLLWDGIPQDSSPFQSFRFGVNWHAFMQVRAIWKDADYWMQLGSKKSAKVAELYDDIVGLIGGLEWDAAIKVPGCSSTKRTEDFGRLLGNNMISDKFIDMLIARANLSSTIFRTWATPLSLRHFHFNTTYCPVLMRRRTLWSMRILPDMLTVYGLVGCQSSFSLRT